MVLPELLNTNDFDKLKFRIKLSCALLQTYPSSIITPIARSILQKLKAIFDTERYVEHWSFVIIPILMPNDECIRSQNSDKVLSNGALLFFLQVIPSAGAISSLFCDVTDEFAQFSSKLRNQVLHQLSSESPHEYSLIRLDNAITEAYSKLLQKIEE